MFKIIRALSETGFVHDSFIVDNKINFPLFGKLDLFDHGGRVSFDIVENQTSLGETDTTYLFRYTNETKLNAWLDAMSVPMTVRRYVGDKYCAVVINMLHGTKLPAITAQGYSERNIEEFEQLGKELDDIGVKMFRYLNI